LSTTIISHVGSSAKELWLTQEESSASLQRKGDDSLEIVELLLNLGCPIDSIWFQDGPLSWLEWGVGEARTPLFTAAEQGRDDVVAYLLSRGADATLVSNKGRIVLDVAESKQRSEAVRRLRQWVSRRSFVT